MLSVNPGSLTPAWTIEHSNAAIAEGWEIFDCGDSSGGPWQIDEFDQPQDWAALNGGVTPPELAGAEVAWAIVANGGQPHHVAALAFLQAHNPQEYALVIGQRKPA